MMYQPGQARPIGWKEPTPEEDRAKADVEFEHMLDRYIYDSDDPQGVGILEILRAERDGLKRQIEASGWHPIANAPTDGTVVDLWLRNGERAADARFISGRWHVWAMGDFDRMEMVPVSPQPTHWMHRPAGPVEEV